MPLNLVVLISGRGSNMQAIHQAILNGKLRAHISSIISDNPKAPGLVYARSQGIPTFVVEKQPGDNREDLDQRLIQLIESQPVDIIVLAGYMRILSKGFIERFKNKIVNMHPALLPNFPGLHAQRQALQAGVRQSGCTVHFVDEGCDTGPIIDQRIVEVRPDDTEETLSERILKEEHQLYPTCLQMISEGRVKVEGRKVRIIK
jgi:phosphoribosylglycinamide formyltransferase 1